ncbi:OmpP1/FadL family transporter [Ornithobacterium rhinotracheale]
MKNKFIKLSCLGLLLASGALSAQQINTNYIEDIYQINDYQGIYGTSRYRALSGSMGALGGDLSAMNENPAGVGVFINSEANFTAGVSSSKLNGNYENSSFTNKNSQFNLGQVGAVMVFNTGAPSEKWKSFALGLNYQKSSDVNNEINLPVDIQSSVGSLKQIYSQNEINSSVTNLSFAGNYDDKLYLGVGLNFRQFESSRLNGLAEFNPTSNQTVSYIQDYSPSRREGTGISVGLGVIGKVNKNLRLGLSYESPTWYRDVSETAMEHFLTDRNQAFYVVSQQNYGENGFNSAQKFTASGALILGKKGLINVDYTYNDFGSVKYTPESDEIFRGVNDYFNNFVSGSSSVKVGAETRVKDLSLRAGFKYVQSPYKEVSFEGVRNTFKPYGDLSGFSLGLGYNFGNFYLDAAYSYSQRDRNHLLSGIYFNNMPGANVKFSDIDSKITDPANPILTNGARTSLEVNTFAKDSGANFDGTGYAASIQDIKEKNNNFSLSLGFRF